MPADDTIAAIATAPGRAAVGIVRASGPAVKSICTALTGHVPPPRRASFRKVTNPAGELIDQALVLYFEGPGSFTGEDTLEVQTHGGETVTREVLQLIIDAGARLARPGEFSERAFLNGKIDLLQAEAIADLIDSASTRAANLARRSLAGEFSRRVRALGDALKSIRVHIEATIDFPDEEVPAATIALLSEQTVAVRKDIESLLAGAESGARINSGIDIAIIGRPNVGKSTLLNRLAGDERAIVDSTPGTTRDVLSVDINLDGLPVRIHDTAGLRETGDRVEAEGVRRARERYEAADAVLCVCTESDEAPLAELEDNDAPIFVIRNKIDLSGEPPSRTESGKRTVIALSAKTGAGFDALSEAILAAFDLGGEADSVLLARDRHLAALAQACAALDFNESAVFRSNPELAAEHLRLAGRALAELTGEFTSEDLLGEIFSTFCLGK